MHFKKIGRLSRFHYKRLLLAVLLVISLIVLWIIPINGRLLILTDPDLKVVGTFPQVRFDPPVSRSGDRVTLYLTDNTPWPYVRLFVGDKEAQLLETTNTTGGIWTWQWSFTLPQQQNYKAVFYYNCLTGCIERVSFDLGNQGTQIPPQTTLLSTKLGLVFADTKRDWHHKAGWDVELLYVQQTNDPDFSIDAMAMRVSQLSQTGIRVLVRVAYDRGQALPPTGDEVALKSYFDYYTRLARDSRLKAVYGYIIGSGFNRQSENSLAPDRLVTPEWYARIFAGYGLDPSRTDNVIQMIRMVNPQVKVLVGPIAPWSNDQTGDIKDTIEAPWLNYMNTLVHYLDATTRSKQAVGFTLVAPDGFAVQASGRVEAPEVASQPAQEPSTNISRIGWNGAQAGFRVYRDWLRIINNYSTTRNLPLFITSANTYTLNTQIEPEQNYPVGWLTSALNEINNETQVQALCWFVDIPYDKWAGFSLKAQQGHLKDGYIEFDQLLQK